MLADYEYADLTDDEILEMEARKREERAKEKQRLAKERLKASSFRFKGGML